MVAADCQDGAMAMTEPKPMIRLDAPTPKPCDDAERRRKALETLRRAHKSADDLHRRIGSMLRQVEELIDLDERKDTAA